MKLAVIIVNYNVKYFLEQALHSVYKAGQGIEMEVWVVDNNSVDGSVEMLKNVFPDVKIIPNTENMGFSKANNQALTQVKAEYSLLLNPDTVLQEDTLQKCIEFMDQHLDCGGLGVRMIDGKGMFLPESKRGLPTPLVAFYKMTGLSALFPKSKIFGKYHLKYLSEWETHEVDVLSGAFMLLRMSTLEQTGFLDEDFFMYGEDIDLSYRITQKGFKNYYFPDTSIIHYKGESTKKKSANYVKVFYNAMVLFAKKHYSQKMAGWFSFFISIAVGVRAAVALVWRFLGSIIFPLMDFLLIYIGYFGIARYWEHYNKFVRNFYPLNYYLVFIPMYILVVMLTIFLSGGYDRPLVLRRLLRGAFMGSLIVFSAYAFLPKNMQFSRAILGLGCAWAVAAPFIGRMGMQFILHRNFTIGGNDKKRIVLIAGFKEGERIRNLLAASMVHHDFLGLVSPSETKPDGYLGTLKQLDEVIEIFNINQVIFSSTDVSSAEIMAIMSKHSGEKLQFKIVPENSFVIIGSNSKNGPGELYSIDVKFAIAEKSNIRRKRMFDLLVLALMTGLFPLLLFLKNGRKMLKHSLEVLSGHKTWVSYAGKPGSENLPALKRGLFSPIEAYGNSELESNINLAYAIDYSPQKDLFVLRKFLFS